MKKTISLSVSEDDPIKLPEEVQRLGLDALKIIWKVAQDIAQKEIDKIQQKYEKCESDILQQKQATLQQVDSLTEQLKKATANIEALDRENQALQVDVNNKIAELKSAHDHINVLQEDSVQKVNETNTLIEELGRGRERIETLEKRLHESEYQIEQERNAAQELRDEAIVNTHARDRLKKDLKSVSSELEEMRQQLRVEKTKAAVDNALVKELRENIKKMEEEIGRIKDEKLEVNEQLQSETNVRTNLEKKVAFLTARNESQEWAHKENITKLEKELAVSREETASVRKRMIGAEAMFEREKKRTDMFEAKVIGRKS